MKLKLYTIIALISTSLVISCKTASKMYQKGNYDEAVQLAAKKLQKDPGDTKLLEIIRQSYRFAVDDHENNIRNNAASTSELRWEWMYNDYVSLQRLYDAVRKVANVYDIIQPMDYSSYLNIYAEKAGDTRFERGMEMMQMNNKKGYQDAYHEFQAALRFKPGNREFETRLNEAYENAVVNVVVLPLTQNDYSFSSYNDNTSGISDALVRSMQFNAGNEFVKFYSSWDARSRNIRADELIDLRLGNVNIGRYYDTRTKKDISKEVLIKETVYRADSVVKEYGRVHAQLTTTRRTMHSDAFLQVNIRDGEGRWLWTDNLSGDHNWSTEFAGFTGDIRALDENDRKMVSRSAESAPSEYEIIRCIMEEINNSLLCRIKEHYSGY